jgi:hypothetical protein
MKLNAEQITEYLNMEAQYGEMAARFKELADTEMGEADYADLCRRYAQATIHMVKLRSFVNTQGRSDKCQK